MPSSVIESIRDVIADEMPEWCWFSNPAPEAISRSTLQFRLGCEDPQLPDGRRQRRVCIDLTKELVERLSAFADGEARDGALSTIRGEISRYFQQLSAEPRFAEWLLSEDALSDGVDGDYPIIHRSELPPP